MHDQLRIFTGSGNPRLTRDICDYLGLPLGRANITRFSNENIFVQIEENVRERDCFVVQPLSSPVSENLVELLIMLDAPRASPPSSPITPMRAPTRRTCPAFRWPPGWSRICWGRPGPPGC